MRFTFRSWGLRVGEMPHLQVEWKFDVDQKERRKGREDWQKYLEGFMKQHCRFFEADIQTMNQSRTGMLEGGANQKVSWLEGFKQYGMQLGGSARKYSKESWHTGADLSLGMRWMHARVCTPGAERHRKMVGLESRPPRPAVSGSFSGVYISMERPMNPERRLSSTRLIL